MSTEESVKNQMSFLTESSEEEKQSDLDYEILIENVRALMDTRAGRDFVWHILERTNVFGSSFTGDANTYFKEGQRDIGLDILRLLEDADVTLFPRLLLEKQERG